jgi:hypothetical protein
MRTSSTSTRNSYGNFVESMVPIFRAVARYRELRIEREGLAEEVLSANAAKKSTPEAGAADA